MKSFLYSLRVSILSLWREKWINLLTMLSISVGFLVLGTFALVTFNIDLTLNRWAEGFGLVVYLKDNISESEKNSLKERLKKDSDIVEVKYISKDVAFAEMKRSLKSINPGLESLEENPLPDSIELRLRRDVIEPVRIKEKASKIKTLSGVEDVQYGEKWLSSLNSIARVMKIIGLLLGSVISVAIAFATYSTIKILFYRKNEEIETLKLLGATKIFIKAPFLIEGFIIGLIGGTIGSLTLFGLYSFITTRAVNFLPSIKGSLVFLPPEAYPAIPIAGAIISTLGSFLALGKIKY
ncbi:MAG: ABC transporter permease [Nitrospirae bacterium]|nr:ABC transporter permease [Nitrospirota bacterium]